MVGTYTYGFDPINSDTDKLRLLLGDTGDGSPSSTTCIFADEELAWFTQEGGGNWHLAAHHACVAAAGKYSKMADRTLGPMSISYSNLSASYRAQAKEEFDNATNSASVSPQPYSFTQETGDRDHEAESGDVLTVPAKFYRDQYENQGDNGSDSDELREHWT